MRLSKTGLAAAAVACLLSGYVFAADHRGSEFASSVSDSVLARASTLAETGAGRIPSDIVDELTQQTPMARDNERVRMALATPAFTPRFGANEGNAVQRRNASFDAPRDQPPSMWLMGAVILLLIGYQLRRKHRLLRPHRFNAL